MPRIAISYRRSDSAATAGRIFDRLTARYGNDAVFMDIEKIPVAVDFRTYIHETLLRTDVLIAIIGANWLGRDESGAVRVRQKTDPVRVEIEIARELNLSLIPVLIDGAKMPDPAELPASFGNFAYLNAAEVSSGRDFSTHMERLIAAINRMAPSGPGVDAAAAPQPAVNTLVGAQSADKPGTPPRPEWRDEVVRYFLVPLVVLLVIHYAVVNSFNLNTNYLRLACVLVPLASGFALFWIGGGGAGPATALALALGLLGAAGMSFSESLYSGDPILPHSRFEWLDNLQFAGMIALSFVIGHLFARASHGMIRRKLGKP